MLRIISMGIVLCAVTVVDGVRWKYPCGEESQQNGATVDEIQGKDRDVGYQAAAASSSDYIEHDTVSNGEDYNETLAANLQLMEALNATLVKILALRRTTWNVRLSPSNRTSRLKLRYQTALLTCAMTDAFGLSLSAHLMASKDAYESAYYALSTVAYYLQLVTDFESKYMANYTDNFLPNLISVDESLGEAMCSAHWRITPGSWLKIIDVLPLEPGSTSTSRSSRVPRVPNWLNGVSHHNRLGQAKRTWIVLEFCAKMIRYAIRRLDRVTHATSDV